MNCYDAIDLMGDAIEGSVAESARAGLEEHLEECPACRNYMDQLRLTRRALGHLPPPDRTSARRSELIERFDEELGSGE